MPIGTLASAEAALGDEFIVEVLSTLVAAPSVNPGVMEREMADTVAAWLQPTGMQITMVEFAPGRPSVAAVRPGAGDGPRLVVNGHMDTVAVDDPDAWNSNPFEASVRDGYVYGRGACDMKGGLAAQIAVAHHLAAAGEQFRGDLILQFAAGEECGEPGTLSMLQHGFAGDFGIVTEPTQLKVAVAERGLCHFVITIGGRSIHASRSHLGVNPLLELRPILAALEDYDREIRERTHPLLPGGSCTPTVVRAGVQKNAVADSCELIVDRRLLPGETVQGELDDLRARLARLGTRSAEATVEVTVTPGSFEPAEIPKDSAFAAIVADTHSLVQSRPTEIYGTPYASDVRNLVNDAGMEAVTFGPGNVAECHCANERVAIHELEGAARVISAVARSVLR